MEGRQVTPDLVDREPCCIYCGWRQTRTLHDIEAEEERRIQERRRVMLPRLDGDQALLALEPQGRVA